MYNNRGASFKLENGSGKTDETGTLKIDVKPEFSPNTDANRLSIYTYSLSASASLPELGDIYTTNELRVFDNDIKLKANSEFKHGTSKDTKH